MECNTSQVFSILAIAGGLVSGAQGTILECGDSLLLCGDSLLLCVGKIVRPKGRCNFTQLFISVTAGTCVSKCCCVDTNPNNFEYLEDSDTDSLFLVGIER